MFIYRDVTGYYRPAGAWLAVAVCLAVSVFYLDQLSGMGLNVLAVIGFTPVLMAGAGTYYCYRIVDRATTRTPIEVDGLRRRAARWFSAAVVVYVLIGWVILTRYVQA